MGRRILLPGWSTLWRLVSAARESADERGWSMLAATLTAEQRAEFARLRLIPEMSQRANRECRGETGL